MKAKLFINYRREDTAPYAGRLYDRLISHFDEEQVFIDIDQIEPGEDFVEVINRKVSACDIAIVAIGPHWLSATDASGKRRLDDEEDFVRMEIVAALQRNIRVIPVLVGGARMPGRHDLPEALAPLSRRNAIDLSETRFHADVNRLFEAIEKSFAAAEKNAELSATPAAPPPEPESKDLPKPSEFTKPAEPKEVDAHAISGPAPASLDKSTRQFPTQAARPYLESERSQQDSVATVPAKHPTTPMKSTQAAPTAASQVPSTSSIAALKESKVWTSERGILVSAIVLFLFAFAGVLIWSAAKQGNQPAISNLNTPSKPAEAQLADQQDAATNFSLGRRYYHGEGVPKDLGKAAELYQKAADQGLDRAQFNLGRLYEYGEGVPKDLGKAAELYQKAADQGFDRAQCGLAGFYYFGKAVPKDLGKAAEFFQKAADQGLADAQYGLGVLYENGEGVPKDLAKARVLYQAAADQGFELAITRLKVLSR